MPTWGELLEELQQLTTPRPDAYDHIRRRAIRNLRDYTQRDAILYAGGHLQKPGVPSLTSIDHSDVEGFMEAIHGISGPNLDLILHSSGGSLEATEAIGEYLRQKFTHIRVHVPHMAMSAATVLACIADEIVLAGHAQLGPIDPQFILQTSFGIRTVAAQAITEQFRRARDACLNNPAEYPVWADMLQQYGPDLLVESENATGLSLSVVEDWLSRFMLSGLSARQRRSKARKIASYLASHSTHLTHSRSVFRDELRRLDPDMNIKTLEADQQLQDLVLTVYHAAMHTFANTRAAKIIENHLGKSYVVLVSPEG